MGYLEERHGMMMIGKTPEGTCPICATKHTSDQPHNRDSLAYQYNFYDSTGAGQRGQMLWNIVQKR